MQNENIYSLRIHIEDTDCTGVVFHSNYLNFMERARSEWIDSLGFGVPWQKENELLFLIHSLNMQFLKPARVHERVEVVSSVKSIRPASIIFDQRLRLSAMPDKILCKAEIKLVCVDFDLHPKVLPEASIFKSIKEML